MNTSAENNLTTISNVFSNPVDVITSWIYIATGFTTIVLSLPTNFYVLWLILTGGEDLMTSHFFTLNLSVSDILYCLFLFVSYLQNFVLRQNFQYMTGFISGLLYSSRPMFQCCICVERYLAVIHPVLFLTYKHLRYKITCAGMTWLIVIGSCLIFITILESLGRSIAMDYLMCNYLVWLCVKLFCCLAVLKALKRPGPGEGNRERGGTNDAKMRAFWIILIVLVSSLSCYFPMILMIITQHFTTVDIGIAVCFAIVNINGFVSPLLFLHINGKLASIRCSH